MSYKDQKVFERKMQNIRVLLSYKVFPCKRDGCVFNDRTLAVPSHRCEFYHGPEDQRRFTFVDPPAVFHNNENLIEKIRSSQNYGLSEFFADTAGRSKTGRQNLLKLSYSNSYPMTPDNGVSCGNLIEYLYHPLNFKSVACNEGLNCTVKYCPKVHNAEEQAEFQKFRRCLENTDIIQKQSMEANNRFRNAVDALLSVQHGTEKAPPANDVLKTGNQSADISNFEMKEGENNHQDVNNFHESRNQQQANWNLQKVSRNSGYNKGNNQSYSPTPQSSYNGQANKYSNPKGVSDKHRMHNGENKSTDLAEVLELQKETSVDLDESSNIKRVSSQNIKPNRIASISIGRRESLGIKFNSHSKKQVVKIGGMMCKPNHTKAEKFILNAEVDIYENIHIEFKNFALLNVKTATSYICAYLNSYGGTMFFGINDNGIVKGIQLSRKDIDDFQINLDICLRNFQPRVMPDQVKLEFHEISVDDKQKYVLLDRYVVQIDIFCNSYSNFYSTDDNQFLIKRNGSINHLIPTEIVQYVKERHNPLISQDNLQQRINPVIFDIMNKSELDRAIRNLEEALNLAKQATQRV
jgi:hypothetical protein